MKRTLLTIIFIAGFFFIASAQTEKEDIAIVQSVFGKTKKAVISDNIQFSETEQTAFGHFTTNMKPRAMRLIWRDSI